MYHNAFESVKAKVRGAEATATEKPGSFFSAIRQEHKKNMSTHRKMEKGRIDIRQYFTQVAIRDNIMAYVLMQYCERNDFNSVVCTS